MTQMLPKLVTYLLIKNQKRAFLVQYKDSPNPKRNGWWIPAPELTFGEHPEDCATRILKSIGSPTANVSFKGVDSFVTKDWHILFYYVAEVAGELALGPEYSCGEWFDLDKLPEPSTFAHGKWERDLVMKLAT